MSLRSPKQRGFVPLTVTKSNSSAVTDARMNQDFGIPLAPIRSNNSTGARKAGEGIQNDFSTAPTLKSDSEKGGFFHHKTAGRRRVERSDSSRDDEVAVNGLGRLYKKIIEASVVFRYMVRHLISRVRLNTRGEYIFNHTDIVSRFTLLPSQLCSRRPSSPWPSSSPMQPLVACDSISSSSGLRLSG